MSEFTTTDGVRLHYTDDGQGQTFVFLTGWAMAGEWFREQRLNLSSTHRIIIIDPRAQGLSEPVTWGHRLARHATDLRELLAFLSVDEAVFVAWSRGTSVLLSYFELFGSEQMTGMVLCGFAPSFTVREGWPWGFNLPPQTFLDTVVADYTGVVSTMIVDMTHRTLDPGLISELTRLSLNTPPLAAARMLEDHMYVDLRDQLPRIDVPVLICAGAFDPQAPLEASQASADLIPDATLVTFDDSGHCVFIEQPEEFNEVLVAFGDRVSH